MTSCKKCSAIIPGDSRYCCYCGFLQSAKLPSTRQKLPNGMGTAYKRGKTWTIKIVVGWKKADDGHKLAVYRTKGGFKTKKDALLFASTLYNYTPQKLDTLDQIWERWRQRHTSRVGDSTMAGYASAYKHFATVQFTRIDRITANMLQDCIDHCPRGKRTKQLMKVVANLLMKYAMDDNQILKNPAENLYTGDDPTTTRDPITEDELKVIRAHFQDEPYAAYVYALCYLGFRPSEFLSLKKTDYHDDKGRKYLVGGEKTEAGIDRPVTIPPSIEPIITDRLNVEGTNLLFPRYDKDRKGNDTGFSKMTESYFRESIFKPMMTRLGISGKVPYSTRHTYANKIKKAAGADRDKAALMGHADYETTKKHYQSTDLDDRKSITDQL